jgi:hypothetical protein
MIGLRAYHNTTTLSITWADCDLRAYLNGDFYNSFSATDRARIAETRNVNKNNQWFGTSGGPDTTDKIFLLSLEEVIKYYGDSGKLANRPADNPSYISDEYNTKRVARRHDSATYYGWWLRSPGIVPDNKSYAAYVDRLGGVDLVGNHHILEYGVRPALWLNLY